MIIIIIKLIIRNFSHIYANNTANTTFRSCWFLATLQMFVFVCLYLADERSVFWKKHRNVHCYDSARSSRTGFQRIDKIPSYLIGSIYSWSRWRSLFQSIAKLYWWFIAFIGQVKAVCWLCLWAVHFWYRRFINSINPSLL